MPGAGSRFRPLSAGESDEGTRLELLLQQQLEEDIASDVYTECNIKLQEQQIIEYLNDNLHLSTNFKAKDVTEDADVFLTPKSLSPYVDNVYQKSISSSPSTDLTKQYYALVPIEANLLDRELKEQDDLSSAFQCIIKTQLNKHNSLSLCSSHAPQTLRHSNSCESSQIIKSSEAPGSLNNIDITNGNKIESNTGRGQDCKYSPDSLIADDPSSSSDYLSAVYCSPGVTSRSFSQLNVEDISITMDKTLTSDSGLENSGMLESLNGQYDVTLTDVSLTESTLNDLITDNTNNSLDTVSSLLGDINPLHKNKHPGITNNAIATSSNNDYQPIKYNEAGSRKSSKEEKQRLNEEIVILESSSLSSETGSWESVFPPKLAEKELCQKFLNNERQSFAKISVHKNERSDIYFNEDLCPSLVQKSPFKSTSCFIDAASLVDDEDAINIAAERTSSQGAILVELPTRSMPLPCCTAKVDMSPNDWSETNDIDDSLEQSDNKDPDSIQKDISPTIFEMTFATDDAMSSNVELEEKNNSEFSNSKVYEKSLLSGRVSPPKTPHNSILSLKSSSTKNESDESESGTSIISVDNSQIIFKTKKCNESTPIISGGASIRDHLPQVGSPLSRRKIENIPIVSGAYFPIKVVNNKKSIKPSCSPAWVIDMSSSSKSDDGRSSSSITSCSSRRPGDASIEDMINDAEINNSSESCNRIRTNIDSDINQKTSHKFFIDISTLPVSNENSEAEKAPSANKSFTFVPISDETNVKEMPARFATSLKKTKNGSTAKPNQKSQKSLVQVFNDKVSDKSFSESFEKYESMCNNPDISVSEIIANEKPVNFENTPSEKVHESITKRANKSDCIFEEPCEINEGNVESAQTSDLFVKLSDLDKPIESKEDLKSSDVKLYDSRMTRSIPDNDWGDKPPTCSSRSIDVISSFHSENALSLNRLFPHLKNDFSKSMPGSLSARTLSPLRFGNTSIKGELDEHASDMSEVSSMQSSTCRPSAEFSTTDETSQSSNLIENCQSRLGKDLLRMFVDEIAPDVIVEVAGRRFKAHKCILSSRCQYFAAILSGGWVQSAGNIIVLPPFSFNVVYFALCHIYSGVSVIPDTVSIVELATLADMLGLEGLKEAIMFTLKAKYCHHFHKPCAVCTAGVLECFPLSSVYGLDDLYRKCLKWITKHFSKVWPTKAFATLPKDLLEKCYQQHVINLSPENFVETVCQCGITVSSLQNSRWSESVGRLCQRLINAAAHFAALRLVTILKGLIPLPLETAPAAKQALIDCLGAAIEWAPPDEACRTYAFLTLVVKEKRSQQYAKPDLIAKPRNNFLMQHANTWRLQCECGLVRAAPRVVSTQAFIELPSELRQRLRELGCIMYGAQAMPYAVSPLHDRKVKSTYQPRPKQTVKSHATQSLSIDHVRNSFVPYASKPVPNGSCNSVDKSNLDIRDSKKLRDLRNPPQIRTTKAQEKRASYNLTKTHQSKERDTPVVARSRFEKTKPRYLETRVCRDGRKIATSKLVPKMASSSESSRNSSPILSGNQRASRLKSHVDLGADAKLQAMSQDSLLTSSRPRTAEPSTDSLSESQASNKYATYTRVKHTSHDTNPVKRQSPSQSSSKPNTKIPVRQPSKLASKDKGQAPQKRAPPVKATVMRNVPCSLMCATKSSSAKMVPKVVKDAKPAKAKATKQTNKRELHECSVSIPVMERSGTFLKDEPTFGDTNVDIHQ